MPSWIMPLFIFSGLLMLISVYLTIKYRLYCVLNSPEREIAMELYKKTLLSEEMSSKQIERYENYQRDTKLYAIGMRVLFITSFAHVGILIGNDFFGLFLYKLSVVLLIPMYIRSYSTICFSWVFSESKETILNSITIYLNKYKGKILNEEDSKFYKDERYTDMEFIIVTSAFKIGVILILILDLISLIVMFK